jgi:hypothetical protein
MGLSNIAKKRRACQQKTRRGNVYRSKERADIVVNILKSKDIHSIVQSYHCQICHQWHIGNPALRDL